MYTPITCIIEKNQDPRHTIHQPNWHMYNCTSCIFRLLLAITWFDFNGLHRRDKEISKHETVSCKICEFFEWFLRWNRYESETKASTEWLSLKYLSNNNEKLNCVGFMVYHHRSSSNYRRRPALSLIQYNAVTIEIYFWSLYWYRKYSRTFKTRSFREVYYNYINVIVTTSDIPRNMLIETFRRNCDNIQVSMY